VHKDQLSHYTATKGHCKNAILLYNQFKGGRSHETWPNIKGHNVTRCLRVKGAAPLEISQLVLSGACAQQNR